MNILHLLLPLFFVFINCNLFNSDGDKEFIPIFKAEINGELFDISEADGSLVRIYAGLTKQGDYSLLSFFGSIYDENLYPYRESINLSVFWDANETEYDAKRDSVLLGAGYTFSGGRYYEYDGDAQISTFRTTTEDIGFISAELEELNDGRKAIFGSFEFTIVMDSRTDLYSQRVGQDTLYITNGEYRLLLDDRREE